MRWSTNGFLTAAAVCSLMTGVARAEGRHEHTASTCTSTSAAEA